jgi:hypothetical protein
MFKVPERDDNGGTTVAELVDRLVALRLVDKGDALETKYGDKPFVKVDVTALELATGARTEIGELLVLQDVLVKKLSRYELGDLVVGRIIQPGRAYLFRTRRASRYREDPRRAADLAGERTLRGDGRGR